jgi:hypothetical protein
VPEAPAAPPPPPPPAAPPSAAPSARKRALETPSAAAPAKTPAVRSAARLTVPKSPQLSTAARRRAAAADAAEAAAAFAAGGAAREEAAQALKRRRLASAAAAAATPRAPPALTRPSPFELRTSSRTRAAAASSPTAAAAQQQQQQPPSPYIPLAERLLRDAARTPPRFKPTSASAHAPLVAEPSAVKPLTRAVSPPLATAARGARAAAAGGGAKSSDEIEAERIASLPRFRARPADAAILAPRGIEALTPRRKMTHAGGAAGAAATTPAAPFVFSTDARAAARRESGAAQRAAADVPRFGFAAGAEASSGNGSGMEWTPRRTRPVSPRLATARRGDAHRRSSDAAAAATAAAAAAAAPSSAFKARPAPRADAPVWVPTLPRDAAASGGAALTEPASFALATERRGDAYMRTLSARLDAQAAAAAAAARGVRARAVPAAVHTAPAPLARAPQLPPPAPLALPGDVFHSAAVAALAKRRAAAAAAAEAASRGVRAARVPASHVAPFVPAPCGAPLTETDDVALASDARAERRRRWEEAAAARNAQAEAEAAQAAAAQAARDAAELAALRASLVHTARPAPAHGAAAFTPRASKRALTEPMSPTLATKRRCGGK